MNQLRHFSVSTTFYVWHINCYRWRTTKTHPRLSDLLIGLRFYLFAVYVIQCHLSAHFKNLSIFQYAPIADLMYCGARLVFHNIHINLYSSGDRNSLWSRLIYRLRVSFEGCSRFGFHRLFVDLGCQF